MKPEWTHLITGESWHHYALRADGCIIAVIGRNVNMNISKTGAVWEYALVPDFEYTAVPDDIAGNVEDMKAYVALLARMS